VAARTEATLRVVEADQSGPVVLHGGPGRLRGRIHLVNETDAPLATTAPLIIASTAAGDVSVTPTGSAVVAPGRTQPVLLRATIDPSTPPGVYDAEISFGGAPVSAVIQVIEEVSLRFSPASMVVDGTTGTEQLKTLLVTNTGNVALPVSDLGPTELEIDGPRPSLLDRLLGRTSSSPTNESDDDDDGDDDDDDDDDDPPTVTATLAIPVLVQPGETVSLDWSVVVDGTLRAGARYRADVPCHTTDVEIIVVPHQRSPITAIGRSTAGTKRATAARRVPATKTPSPSTPGTKKGTDKS
jgi:hypothetical protein